MHRLALPIHFCSITQLLLLVLQLLCYINQYYVVLFLLGPRPFWAILVLTFANSRAITALYYANATHQPVPPKSQGSQYCKKCREWISYRDHHCVFTGRCVEKQNYGYFVSYVFYSYFLSTILVASILCEHNLLLNLRDLQLHHSVALVAGLVSGLFFMIFTAGLLSGSFRSIFLGIYTVQELKGIKQPGLSNKQLRLMWLSGEGRRKLCKFVAMVGRDFSANWKRMVGSEVSFKDIVLVL